jgi:hypothetical protein
MFKYSSHFYFDKGLKIAVDLDFLHYYLWHIYRGPMDSLGQMLPKYRGHISVTLPKFHGNAVKKSEKFAGQPVDFWYDGYLIAGGQKNYNGKQHRNYWMKVQCPRADEIKKIVGAVDTNSYGLHCTISTNKNFIKQ